MDPKMPLYYCNHTCGCYKVNKGTNIAFVTPKFNTSSSKGASISNHQRNSRLHPKCGVSCVSYLKLTSSTTSTLTPKIQTKPISVITPTIHTPPPIPETLITVPLTITQTPISTIQATQVTLTTTCVPLSITADPPEISHQIQADPFDKPYVYSPTSESLHDVFKSYDAFIAGCSLQSGNVIRFVKVVDSGKWELIPAAKTHNMTVGQWHEWYCEASKLSEDCRMEALYLVNITVLPKQRKCFKTDPITMKLRHKGTMCLHRYIVQYDSQFVIPDMDARLYLAPPWTGQTFTPPHFDGNGTQLSLHRVLMGDGYNLVHLWLSLLPREDSKWRKLVGLPASKEPQLLPHSMRYILDSSTEVWDVEKEAALQEWGIYSTRFEVHPGQAIVLPTGAAHVFKKISQPPPPIEDLPEIAGTLAKEGTLRVPILGYAGDCSYVGPTAESFRKNYALIQLGHQSILERKGLVYSFYELALLYLVYLACQDLCALEADDIMREHFIGALIPFSDFVEKDKEHSEKFIKKASEVARETEKSSKNKKQRSNEDNKSSKEEEEVVGAESDEFRILVMGDPKAQGEFICAKCKCCLANFILTCDDDSFSCYPCWETDITLKLQSYSMSKKKKKKKVDPPALSKIPTAEFRVMNVQTMEKFLETQKTYVNTQRQQK